MSAVENILHPDALRAALLDFWSGVLAIEKTPSGIAVALPQSGADGWQLVVEITPASPGKLRLSDAGRTLRGLAALGQNIEASAVSDHIQSILRVHEIHRDGFELYRWVGAPFDPSEIHVFAEGLSGISHLSVLHEPVLRSQDIADRTLRRVFDDHKIEARAGATLAGKTEKSVRVNYLVESRRPVAFEIIRRRRSLLPVMEQWGFRWQDIQKVNPSLMPVMLYDPALQEIDDDSRAIGEEVCTLFCAYSETSRIHAVLTEAAA